jgi:hypothetical protein
MWYSDIAMAISATAILSALSRGAVAAFSSFNGYSAPASL